MTRWNTVLVPVLAAGLAAVATPGDAATGRWVLDSAADLLAGRGDAVAVTTDGRLEPAARWTEGVTLDEPVVLAAVRDADGEVVVGTSHPAVLYRATPDGVRRIAELDSERITAMVAGHDGSIWVAAGSPAVVYRLDGDELAEAGRLEAGGIWDLAVFEGDVVAATGSPAALYRLGSRGLERWLELPDRHARCLAPADDRLLVGTSGEGLVLSVTADGSLGVVADSEFTEISDLVVAPDGAVWATTLVGEPASPKKKKAQDDGDNGSDESATVAVDLELPKVNGKTATSEVVRLTPEGAILGQHRFTSQVASSLAWDGGGVLVGTGFEGEVWRFVPDGGALLATLDAVQVTALVDGGAVALTQGPAAVRWRSSGDDRPARFRSAPKTFERPVRFGEYRVWGTGPDAAIRFRAGVSAEPDGTWLPWSEWSRESSGTTALAPGRVIQWEVELPRAPEVSVDRVEVAYREINLPPVFKSVTVEDPGVIYLAAPPPSGPVIEAEAPDASGIFTVVDEESPRQATSAKGKKFYRVGYRTVSWEAADPNGHALRYQLEVERSDGVVLPVRERIEGTQLAVDTSALPDGRYRFKVTASDRLASPAAPGEASRSSGWFLVDTTPPRVEIERAGDEWVVRVEDDGGGVARLEWSRDGDRWRVASVDDGVVDGRRETFRFPAVDGSHLVVVRALDTHFNRTTAAAEER